MDLSSLSESQQQQLQQLHQQFQQHQQERQQEQQQQQYQAAAYDPSQVQATYDPSQYQSYDQSSYYEQPYYQYQQQQQQQQQQQYHQSYYQQPDYTNAYQQQQSQFTQNDSIPIQPPGISAAPEAAAAAVATQQQQVLPVVQQQQQQNSYYPGTVVAGEQQGNPDFPVPTGLNPAAAAAVAALSQLTQFAGTMDAAERAMAGVHERQWQGKNVGYGPGGGPMHMQMPPYMAPHGGYHQGPYPGQRSGRSPFRGGGRRGGGRGNGRGNYGHRPPRTDGSNPQFSGRGRGRGGNRRFPQRAATSHPDTASTGEPASAIEHGDVEESAMVSASAPPSVSVLRPHGKASSNRRQPQIAWCELCRVDCTSLDILEQHKNGKKHKKNLQRFEELQKAGNPLPMPMNVTNSSPAPGVVTNPTDILASAPAPVAASSLTTPGSAPPVASSCLSEPTTTPMPDVQNEQLSLSESKSEVIAQPENVDGDDTNKSEAPQDMSTEVPTDESKMESELQNDMVGQAGGEEGEPTETPGKKRRFDRLDSRKRGMNRKMRGGRGSKRMRTFDRPTWPVEPPKPKEVVPIICDLCNVKCDTPAVFETHLAGKKHISKLKRFEGHQAMFGPVGLQALYPPNPNTQPIFIPQVHQQNMYAPPSSFHQPVAYVPHAQHAATVSESQLEQNPEGDGAHVTWYGSQNEVDPASEGHQGAIMRQEGQLATGNIPENSVARSEEKIVDNPSEASVLPPQENTMTVSEHVAFAKDKSVTVADYRVTTTTMSENVTLSGIDTKIESTSRNEE
ncbi:hypothetical protein AQUCO_01300739v1 [Aquilegia coerulea]|uniref:U1-type domain-containing protein n=1 Tax=Aquilegia coerulea TaxID=218851 RepID=A0A2G5E390_AQUCA|nr:hypothetical protein AQUCO_01300739v1 [Aquilegia coerulea]